MGVSYGTRVALVAALSQPQARRIILDSPYPLDRGGVSDAGLLWAQTFADFWRECAERGCEFSEENFWQLMAHLRQQPQPVQVEDWNSGGQVSWLLNDGRLAAAVYSTFYSGDLRYQVAPALRRLIEGDIQPLLPLLEIFYNQAFDSSFNSAIFWATECNDNPLQSEQYFLSTLGQLGRWREYFAADWQFDLCRSTAFHPGQIPAMQPLEIPVLVAGGALDPITTHEHARELMPWLPRGQLLILPDRSHAEFYGSDCGERLIPWFLNADEVSIQAEWPAQSLSCRPAN
jgi:TAP-like protein.